MCILKWFRKNESLENTHGFIQLMKDLWEKQEECQNLHKALNACGWELYKRTGEINHSSPQYWIGKITDERNSP